MKETKDKDDGIPTALSFFCFKQAGKNIYLLRKGEK